ncbi:unnamed protein product, partial [Coregonus sp. 'balchen']
MKRRNPSCLIVTTMGTLFLLMVVLYGTINSQQSETSGLKQDYRLLGRPLYKLDINWPKYPELFSGEVFGVAVNQYAGPYGHSIKQYSPSGKLLQVLGSMGEAGSGVNPLQFDQPAEVFVHSSGEIYIVDGDGGMNNRLIKLSKDLEVQWMHGEKGQGLAQFYIPHSVAVDNYQRAPPVGVIGQCQVVSVIQLAEDVKPHLVDLDLKTGALYVAEIGAQQAQKFTPFSL